MKTKLINYPELTEKEVKFYKEYGYLMLPGLVNPLLIEGLRNEALQALEAVGIDTSKLNKATEVEDKLRNSNHYLKNSLLDELINGEETINLASQLIGGSAIRYFPFAVVKSGGGGGDFHFHQDNNYTRHEPAEGSINIWVALVDMTPDNGCLQVVPRSNKLGPLESEDVGDNVHRKIKGDVKDALPLRMRAGDAVAFSRLTVHGSGPNITSKPRIAYALQYHREDVKYLDRKTNEWKVLKDQPEFDFAPK
jgi:2-oxoglutarate-dependent dioxygenase